MISRETERFVNEVHDHKEELRSSSELITGLQESERSEPQGKKRGTKSTKETCASTSSKETCAGPLSVSTRASPNTKRTIPTSGRKRKIIHAHSPDGGDLADAVSRMVTKMVRHCDQYEREEHGSHHWDTIRPVLVRPFAIEEAQDFDDDFWLHSNNEGSTKKRFEYCKDEKNPLCYFRAIQGHSGGVQIRPELHTDPAQLERVHLSQGNSVEFSISFGECSLLHTSESIRKRLR